jgi:hypothetical protein
LAEYTRVNEINNSLVSFTAHSLFASQHSGVFGSRKRLPGLSEAPVLREINTTLVLFHGIAAAYPLFAAQRNGFIVNFAAHGTLAHGLQRRGQRYYARAGGGVRTGRWEVQYGAGSWSGDEDGGERAARGSNSSLTSIRNYRAE